jgi:predicted glycosyltransferase
MLAICDHLRRAIPDVSILIVSGSPMLHSFRSVEGIDYIKLPCLRRTEEGELGVRFLSVGLAEVAGLRSRLILSTVQSFRPDVLAVDKMPNGLAGELEPTLAYLRRDLPETRILLVLRDILDSSKKTTEMWRERHYYTLVEDCFDGVAVLGQPHVFDVRTEYHFPEAVRLKTWFCGYISKDGPVRPRAEVHRELQVSDGDELALVTTGGGEDGYQLLEHYLKGLPTAGTRQIKSLIITGPDLVPAQARAISTLAQTLPGVRVLEFTADMLSYINAADVLVSMAGYNTICEILSLKKKAVVVPRVRPVEEQRIRAERMSERSLLQMILPGNLTPRSLWDAVTRQLHAPDAPAEAWASIDLGGLPRVAKLVMAFMRNSRRSGSPARALEGVALVQ